MKSLICVARVCDLRVGMYLGSFSYKGGSLKHSIPMDDEDVSRVDEIETSMVSSLSEDDLARQIYPFATEFWP